MKMPLFIITIAVLSIHSWAIHDLRLTEVGSDTPVTNGYIYDTFVIQASFEQVGATASFLFWVDINQNGKIDPDLDFCPARIPEDLHNFTITDGDGQRDLQTDGLLNLPYKFVSFEGRNIWVMEDNGVSDTMVFDLEYKDKTTGYTGKITLADGSCASRMRIGMMLKDQTDPDYALWSPNSRPLAQAYVKEDGTFEFYYEKPWDSQLGHFEVCNTMKLFGTGFGCYCINRSAVLTANTVTTYDCQMTSGSGGTCGSVAIEPVGKNTTPNTTQAIYSQSSRSINVTFNRFGVAEVQIFDVNGKMMQSSGKNIVREGNQASFSLPTKLCAGIFYAVVKINGIKMSTVKMLLK